MKCTVFFYIVSSVLLFQPISTSAWLTIGNPNFSGKLKIDLFDDNESRIDILELYKDQKKTVNTGTRTVKKMRWQIANSIFEQSMRYEILITIPWFFLSAGIFFFYADGTYWTLFFGKGKAEGVLTHFWK
jgi:hypothetical protein